MVLKGVFFDFDGVVADTETLWMDCIFEYISIHSINIIEEELVPFVGCGDCVLKNRLIRELHSEEAYIEAYQWMRDRFEQRAKELKPREGIVQWLEQIRGAGLFTMIVSSSDTDTIQRRLGELGLTRCFDGCVTAEDMRQIKPNPDLYLEALKRTNCTPDEVICFEDSLFGLLAAEAAGIYCVLLPTKLSEKVLTLFPNLKINMRDMTFKELVNKVGIELVEMKINESSI